jgi:hypothetical protein
VGLDDAILPSRFTLGNPVQGTTQLTTSAPGQTVPSDVLIVAALAGCRAASTGTGFSVHEPITFTPTAGTAEILASGSLLYDAGADAGIFFSVAVWTGASGEDGDEIIIASGASRSLWANGLVRFSGADNLDPISAISPVAFGTDADPSVVTIPGFLVPDADTTILWIMGGSFVGTNPVTAQPFGISRVGSINSNAAYQSFLQAGVQAGSNIAGTTTPDFISGNVPKSGSFAWNCRPAAIAMAIRPGSYAGVQFVGTDGVIGQPGEECTLPEGCFPISTSTYANGTS